MTTQKNKNLLLLGVLSGHSLHGYELSALLKAPGNPIRIGKANAYQLLAKLADRGLVQSREERRGNRPPRQVYSITARGRAEFERLLRERLAEYETAEHPDGVSLNFIESLAPDQAVTLLQQRLASLAERCATLGEFSNDTRESHPGLDYLIRQAAFERDFLAELIEKLKGKRT